MNASDLIKPPPNLARRGPSTYDGHQELGDMGVLSVRQYLV